MIIIPELKTVVILVPRTGSGSLYRALMAEYGEAMMPYRHMEADGVPHGYDQWRKVGVCRHPVDRLWSLYKYCNRDVRFTAHAHHFSLLKRSASLPFDRWIVENEGVFASPYGPDGKFDALYAVKHNVPETRKSQWTYLRPDLGTVIYTFERKQKLAEELGVSLGHSNATDPGNWPALDDAALDHVRRYFAWDLDYYCDDIEAAA